MNIDPKNHSAKKEEPKIGRTILDDISQGDLAHDLFQDLKDIYNFYIDEEKRTELQQMGQVRRAIKVIIWILKSLFFKLTPVRRILLVIALILPQFTYTIKQTGSLIKFNQIGFALLLLILALELKDKLLARDEIEVGRRVQLSLLPSYNPTFPGWELWLYTHPANDVGGDLVDYLKLDNNRLGIALGDVAGKGLGAALLMSKLQATLRALAPNARSLAELGVQMNAIFCRDGLPSRFASLVYLEISPDSGQVHILNAGHMPPLTLREKKVSELKRGAPALGLTINSTYREQLVELNAGDFLIVYSDGVTEAQNGYRDFFGEQRLFNILVKAHNGSTESIGNRILDSVHYFIGDARPSDDLSLVILKKLPLELKQPEINTQQVPSPPSGLN
ncbi:serine/threonine-protein phosphatase [candidate division KSB1 bacterium]|nr:serine/threonine-protein phosphatase [candidate division KSB1 bacterium]